MNTWWKWAIFGAAILLVGWGLWSLVSAKNNLQKQNADLAAQLSKLESENGNLSDQIDYLKNPANLVKELEAGTSYRPQDAKLIIVTAGATSTDSTSTATSTK